MVNSVWERSLAIAVSVLLLSFCNCPSARAFDIKSGISKDSGPFDLFKFGYNAQKNGNTEDAVEAYRYAAEKGHTGSRWALANMYADGDGVVKNDYEAFKIYSEIADQGVEPGSEDSVYFVHALMALAHYYREGIANSPVKIDLNQARQLYFQAASAFGFPDAQYQLGRMLLNGEGGKKNVQQAKKWLNLARKNGHAGAMALLGNVLFQEGQKERGLAFMTAAIDKCAPKDCPWIEDLQERAFSLADEKVRRVAVAMAPEVSQQP
ncbi:sel1 repeat family protein [Allorhizobium sp. BGMRC 0089]|uniref:exopolysaccharide production regulator ExoR n=1 Tax=Allorhizobium sonneratiae TaxID=2934936 RepID=UPI003B849864|nr:sel1 repeat family protein [Allorhizobium sonneratiae]